MNDFNSRTCTAEEPRQGISGYADCRRDSEMGDFSRTSLRRP